MRLHLDRVHEIAFRDANQRPFRRCSNRRAAVIETALREFIDREAKTPRTETVSKTKAAVTSKR